MSLVIDNQGRIKTTGRATNPAGADTQVQYNDGGSFGADAGLTWDKTNKTFVIARTGGPPTLDLTNTGTQTWRILLIGATDDTLSFRDVDNGNVDVFQFAPGCFDRSFTVDPTRVSVNAAKNDLDFRASGDTEANMIYVDAAHDELGVGTATPDCRFEVANETSKTTTTEDIAMFTHNSSGTPGAGFGTNIVLRAESSTTLDLDIVRLSGIWDVATHASRSGALIIYITNASGEVESAKFDDDGTAGNTRFLVYDVDNGQLERVSVGAADSGGAGYKVLRIPN